MAKQKWLVASLALALAASVLGNWFQRHLHHEWFSFQSNNEVTSAGPEARMVMTTRRLLDTGDLEGVRKRLGFMLQGHTDYLRIVVENDRTLRRASPFTLHSSPAC